MVGTLMTLFVYDIYNERLVFAVALGFPGFLNLLTPFFASEGGYYVTTILRFFTGLYSAILTPVIPALAFNWFLSEELYKMSIGIFLGIESGRMFFCLTGAIIDNFGWEFLFYFPGAFSVTMAILYYIFMTDDPLENAWISPEEKKLMAECHNREYKPSPALSDSSTSSSSLGPRLKKYKAQMKFKKLKSEKPMRTPWKEIFCTRMLWLATLQATAQVCEIRNRVYKPPRCGGL